MALYAGAQHPRAARETRWEATRGARKTARARLRGERVQAHAGGGSRTRVCVREGGVRGVVGDSPVYRTEDGAAAGVFQIITSGCGSGGTGGFPWQPQYLQSPIYGPAAQPSGATSLHFALFRVSSRSFSVSTFSCLSSFLLGSSSFFTSLLALLIFSGN